MKVEKKTKDLGTFVIMNQKTVLEYLDEIIERFRNDESYRERILEEMLPERKYRNTKNSQEYRVISRILKDEIGIQGAGQTTVWRLLKIREEAPELYEKIKENRISIRAAYNELFPEKTPKKKEAIQDRPLLMTRGKLDFGKLKKELEFISAELDRMADEEKRQPGLRQMKEIDTELFRIRKKIGAMIIESDRDDFI